MPEKRSSTWEQVDDRIQSVVDAFAFFCMRHLHVSKTYLRFALASVFTVVSGSMYLNQQTTGNLIIFGLCGTIVVFDYAHVRGYQPQADSNLGGYYRAFIVVSWFLFLILVIMVFLFPAVDQAALKERFEKIQYFLMFSALVVYTYLSQTPREPPPRKRRETKTVIQAIPKST